jgi:hypothetical protein
MFVIYQRDDHLEVRRWYYDPDTGMPSVLFRCTAGDLEEARACVPEGLRLVEREPNDPLGIVESWLEAAGDQGRFGDVREDRAGGGEARGR